MSILYTIAVILVLVGALNCFINFFPFPSQIYLLNILDMD